jgi:GntR family transcriptional regulator
LQVAALLREEIRSGKRPPGSRLPSIIDLTQEHGIARGTAHKALQVLRDEGLAVLSDGRGYYVTRQEPPPSG